MKKSVKGGGGDLIWDMLNYYSVRRMAGRDLGGPPSRLRIPVPTTAAQRITDKHRKILTKKVLSYFYHYLPPPY